MFVNKVFDFLFDLARPVPKPVPVPVRVTSQRPRQDCMRIRLGRVPPDLSITVVSDEEYVRRHGHEMP